MACHLSETAVMGGLHSISSVALRANIRLEKKEGPQKKRPFQVLQSIDYQRQVAGRYWAGTVLVFRHFQEIGPL